VGGTDFNDYSINSCSSKRTNDESNHAGRTRGDDEGNGAWQQAAANALARARGRRRVAAGFHNWDPWICASAAAALRRPTSHRSARGIGGGVGVTGTGTAAPPRRGRHAREKLRDGVEVLLRHGSVLVDEDVLRLGQLALALDGIDVGLAVVREQDLPAMVREVGVRHGVVDRDQRLPLVVSVVVVVVVVVSVIILWRW
jgi:hypothetical protein